MFALIQFQKYRKMGDKKEKKTLVAALVAAIEKPELKFHPTGNFYRSVGINNRRFAKLLRGDLPPTVDEFKSLCSYFKLDPATFLK